eukprot:scaffold9290_cov63-Phaeocystis_antarctica.AAC.2
MVRYRSSSGRRTWYMVQGKQRSANVQAPSSAVQQGCRNTGRLSDATQGRIDSGSEFPYRLN